MQYFVSAEKNSYFYWQLELLIESFKNHNLQDKLVVALADSEDGEKLVPKNISKINCFLHKNWGKNLNYRYINKFLSLDVARKSGLIKPPFVVIEPDMILLNPINIKQSEEIDVLFSTFEQNNLKNYIDLNEDLFFKEEKWKSTGSVVYLNRDCPAMYLAMANHCKKLLEKVVSKDAVKKYWRLIDKISWNLGLLKNHLTFDVDDNLECDLHENKNSNLLHYRNPYEFFSKFNFNKKQKNTLDLEAYVKMMTINPSYSKNIKYLQETINQLLEDQK
jgi:hypothetical protein